MGVYIRGMEISAKKNGAVLIIYPDGRCVFENGEEYKAVPVPPHGRLIDADALDMNYLHIRDDGMKIYTKRAIDNAPTIIPAEPCKEKGE